MAAATVREATGIPGTVRANRLPVPGQARDEGSAAQGGHSLREVRSRDHAGRGSRVRKRRRVPSDHQTTGRRRSIGHFSRAQ